MPIATLNTSVVIAWENQRGCDRDCLVEVEYTFDGEDIEILKTNIVGACDLGDHQFDELVWEAVNEGADDAYSEWLADRDDDEGEYRYGLMLDRQLEAIEQAFA